jgi:hypothetical protein
MFVSLSRFFADTLIVLFGLSWKVILVWSIPFGFLSLWFSIGCHRLKKSTF